MAQFEPSKKTADDFNGGNEYINGDGTTTGDIINADAINGTIEGMLYAQDQADLALETAQDAKDLVDSVVTNAYAPPPVGLHYIQYMGEPTPAQLWASTTWEIDTAYQGKTIIGSGGDYTLGATGGSATHNHTISNAVAQLRCANNNIYYSEQQATATITTNYFRSGLGNEQTQDVGHNKGVGIRGITELNSHLPPYAVVNYWKRIA